MADFPEKGFTKASNIWTLKNIERARKGDQWPDTLAFIETIDAVLVGAGGAGGTYGGGAGGGGGIVYLTDIVASGTITIAIGAGGVGAANHSTQGVAAIGGNTTLSFVGTTHTAYGGGGGGSNSVGGDGASGGGASHTASSGGAGIHGLQGNSGGAENVDGSSDGVGGGGGGGGGTNGGDGGDGPDLSAIYGTSIGENGYVAGGGSGACYPGAHKSGGAGGGGTGESYNQAWPAGKIQTGAANTGGGSGGDWYNGPATPVNGGSGVVLIKVPSTSTISNITGSPNSYTVGTNTIYEFTGTGSFSI